MKSRLHPIHLIVCVVAGASGFIKAQSADSLFSISLDTVTIKSRWDGRALNMGQSRSMLDAADARQMGATNLYDAIEAMPGVQVTTAGLGFKVVNTRGFSNTTNVRFVQLVDGIDNQAPHIGAPIANALGANELDIASVELLPGAAASVYGINALNGVLNIHTRNPFEHRGLTVQQLSGVNHIRDDLGPRYYQQSNFRYARVLHPKVAIKFNGGYMRGYDFIASDTTDLAGSLNSSLGLTGLDNPALDEVNGYGNESSNRRILTLSGKQYSVARTGYREEEVADYHLQNMKGDMGLYMRPRPGHELVYSINGALLNNIYQRSNRFRLQNYGLLQNSLSYTAPAFIAHAFWTTENTGRSYNLRSVAENMDRAHLSDNDWFADYSAAYNTAIGNGMDVSAAHHAARAAADAGRLQPGTPAFEDKKTELTSINNWDQGAALRVRANLLQADAQVIWSELAPTLFQKLGMELRTAADFRSYVIVPDGNYFINPELTGQDLVFKKAGGLVMVREKLLSQRLVLTGALRADKCDYFDWKLNPRLSAAYTGAGWSLRGSYQSGYRFPSIFEGFSNVNSGGVKRVGGLPIMSSGIFESSYTRASIDAFQRAVVQAVNNQGIGQDSAILLNANLLRKNPYTYLRPEHVQSVEIGGRGSILHQRIIVDVEAYFNSFRDFIAQMEASVPLTGDPDSIAFALFDKKQQQRYRLWTNSQTQVYTFGASLALNARLSRKFRAMGNIGYAQIAQTEDTDGLEDGFNTPRWIVNASIIGADVWKPLGFSIGGRYQSRYDYVSFLVSGETPAYWTLDAAVSCRIPTAHLDLKLGASNLLDRPYRSMLGGPTLGAVYSVSVIWGMGD